MVRRMPMRAATIRFTEDLWGLLEREAARQETSVAQLVRDAALMRIAFAMGGRGEPEARATVQSLAARELSAGSGPAGRAVEAVDLDGAPDALLDVPAEAVFDRLTSLATRVLNVPTALVSIVTRDRHHIKSCVGVAEPWGSQSELPITHSFCRHVVVAEEPLVVSDARDHPLLRDNPAIRELGAIAYAGVPLVTAAGRTIGTVCVMDAKPRLWTREDVALLRDLADTAVTTIELRAAVRRARDEVAG
ncbi:MAG: hypothetical protein QOJ97_2321 [Solirubrobacteraceae bacterium]|jgi:GAF domain-containing protein|nr:hypothetical protein [Solirubrobacteraceae bacterium]